MGCLWRDEHLKLAAEIDAWSHRLMLDWPVVDGEIDAWTQRLIAQLRLAPPAEVSRAVEAQPLDSL
jgi:hypothetical protein